ncbi:MAG: N-formylglutamate amidohydrolase [Pseudomonadota bacterium]
MHDGDLTQLQAADLPAFQESLPNAWAAPVIFLSPHSGRHYPASMQAKLAVPLIDLRRTEDAFIDEMFAECVAYGTGQISALYGRSFVDLNRDVRELDATMFADGAPRTCGMPTARVRAGLGVLPRVAASGRDIYGGKPLLKEEAAWRLTHVHEAYHRAVVDRLEALKRDWSDVILIDCHSMPSRQPGRSHLPDFVLGDRFGSSCSGRLTSQVERCLRGLGYSVARNAPYAGGYTTRRYGRPRRGTHALQIEVNRSLYMDEQSVECTRDFMQLKEHMSKVIAVVLNFAQRENG